MNSPTEIWKSFELAEGEIIKWNVGTIRFYAGRILNDWFFSHESSEEPQSVDIQIRKESLAEEMNYERWAFKTPKHCIHFTPIMPDRPLVVRPITPLGIPPESEVQFFINIPARIRISIGDDRSTLDIAEFSSQVLSNTWFGDNFNGILCYSNKSYIRREKNELEVIPNQIICPFKIKNKGNELLKVERICLNVKYLSIYAGQQRLWTNGVTAIFRGNGKGTQLEYSNSAPKNANDPTLLVKALEKPERGFSFQTFTHHSFQWKKEHS
jgi:hypothetical protein